MAFRFRKQFKNVDVAKPSLNTRSQSRGPRVTERMNCKNHGSASPMCSEHQFLHGSVEVAFLKTNVFRACPGEREGDFFVVVVMFVCVCFVSSIFDAFFMLYSKILKILYESYLRAFTNNKSRETSIWMIPTAIYIYINNP